MSEEALADEDERRDFEYNMSPKQLAFQKKQSEFLLNVLVWIVSKPIAHKIAAETMNQEVEILSESSLNGRIKDDATLALSGALSKDTAVFAKECFDSAHELIFG